jgi:hypothetical protein
MLSSSAKNFRSFPNLWKSAIASNSKLQKGHAKAWGTKWGSVKKIVSPLNKIYLNEWMNEPKWQLKAKAVKMNIYQKLAQKTGTAQVLVLWDIYNSRGNLQLVFYKLFMEVDSTGYIEHVTASKSKGSGYGKPGPHFF